MKRIAAAVLAVLLGAGCAAPEGVPFEERFVLELPAGVEDVWFTVSPYGRRAAYAERRGSDAYLVVDGRRMGPYP